jgi:hypothetical protein
MENSCKGIFGEMPAGRSEVDDYAPTVSRIRLAFDEPGRLEAIESDCHPPAGQEEIVCQRGWAHGANEIELGEGLEITAMAEAVGSGDVVKSGLNQVGGAKHPTPHFEWREIEVGAGSLPTREHVIETIGHLLDTSIMAWNVIDF